MSKRERKREKEKEKERTRGMVEKTVTWAGVVGRYFFAREI